MTLKVAFAGEGPDELGAWAQAPAYQPREGDDAEGGVLHALVARYTEHVTVDARPWKSVRKFQAGNHAAPETRTVMGLALRAKELGCDVLVFARDRDRDPRREDDVERGIREAARFDIAIVGGTANEELEAWLLAMLGVKASEALADPKAVLERRGVASREAKSAVVRDARLDDLPEDATSLHRWLDRARAQLKAGEL